VLLGPAVAWVVLRIVRHLPDGMRARQLARTAEDLVDLAEDIDPAVLRSQDTKKTIPILHGALLKNEQDVHLFEQLIFLNRRGR